MRALVADASVIGKCVLLEPGSSLARELVTDADPLLAPEHVVSEGANAVWKAVHRGLISPERSLRQLTGLLEIPVVTLPLRDLTPSAFAIALEYDHPVYDCYYIAAAIQNDCALATADQRLHDLALRVGLGERAILVR